jgi:uncharacterized membrane protein
MSQAASIHFRDAGRGSTGSIAAQRWGALIGGGALAIYGLTRRTPAGIAMAAGGGALAYLGAKADAVQRESVARASVLLNCSPQEAYSFWHNFENLPRFMYHLDTVSITGDRRSRWIALGPMGARVAWDAEIISDREAEAISWRSLPGSDLDVEGSVEFRSAPGNRGTLLTATMRFRPPAGSVGHAVAKLLGKNPHFLMTQDLRRLKALIETGEIPTIEGQSHGPRSVPTAIARVLNPDRPIRREASLKEVFEASRRVS